MTTSQLLSKAKDWGAWDLLGRRGLVNFISSIGILSQDDSDIILTASASTLFNIKDDSFSALQLFLFCLVTSCLALLKSLIKRLALSWELNHPALVIYKTAGQPSSQEQGLRTCLSCFKVRSEPTARSSFIFSPRVFQKALTRRVIWLAC